MKLQPHTIEHVQTTWKALEPIAPVAAQLFYDNLFAAAPDVRALFKGDMDDQGHRLMTMIGNAVRGLRHFEGLQAALRAMGARHVAYGVEDAHYAIVGAALLKTLAQGLGPQFTPEVEEAWTVVYGFIAETMQAGSQAAGARQDIQLDAPDRRHHAAA